MPEEPGVPREVGGADAAATAFALEALDRLSGALRVLAELPWETDLPSTLLREAVTGLRAQGGVLAARRGATLDPLVTVGDLAGHWWSGQLRQLRDALPPTIAIRSGRAVWAVRSDDGRIQGESSAGAVLTLVAVPLLFDGEARGILGLAFAGDRTLTRVEQRFLDAVSHLCALHTARWHLASVTATGAEERTGAGAASDATAVAISPFTFVGVLTPSGSLTEVNRGSLEPTGLHMDDVLGRPLPDTYWWSWSREVQRQLREELARAAGGESRRFHAAIRTDGDRLIGLDCSLVPLMAAGSVQALVLSGIDNGEHTRNELRLDALAQLARRLSAAFTSDEVSRIVVDGSSGVLGATFSSIALLDPETAVVHVLNPARLGLDPGGHHRLPLGAHRLHTDVVRRGKTVVLADPASFASAYPDRVADLEAAGLASVAAVPLRNGDGTVFGALVVGWPHQVDVDPSLRLGVETVADLCAQTLQRTHRSDARNQLVSALQDELLPAVPQVGGLDIAVRYLPATNDLGFSGDWYDVVPLSSERTVVVVGDTAGHGIRAAAQMSHVRGVVNTLARLDTGVSSIFAQAQTLLSHLDDPFIGTATLFVVDTGRDELSYAHAGHPPLLVRGPDGSVASLEGARGPALGMPTPRLQPRSVPFPPGSVAVAYTDGLVERRTRGLSAGIDLLRSTLASARVDDAAALAARIVEELTRDSPLSDDVAMVVVRRTG